ncbi:MAG: TraR/DksA C4-type zinc finger protein [Actinomycetota bacterium]|nr:TraR/DksA C4-type zinc finger protein [Actinomycetota bacterium]
MDKKKVASFKKNLSEEKVRLEKELREIEVGNLNQSQSVTSGENSYEDHFADSGTATFERERDLSLDRNARDILARVRQALDRIENGTYGICTHCGKEIDLARLEALPYADLCIVCKKKEEGW